MRPETGGAGYFTLMVADTLEDMGRPVTVEELCAAINRRSGVPWNWICQRHQQHLATMNSYRRKDEGTANGSAVPSSPCYDPVLGWGVEGYDPTDRDTRRAALRYVTRKRLADGKRSDHKKYPWAIQDPDGRWRRNPDAHPKVLSNGKRHQWDPATRAASEAEAMAQVKTINLSSVDRQLAMLGDAERTAVLRWLVGQLPAADHRERSTSELRTLLRDVRSVYGDASPDELRRAIVRYAGAP